MYSLHHLLLALLAFATVCQPPSSDTALTADNQAPVAQAAAEPPACDCCVFDEQHPTAARARLAPDTAIGTLLRISGTVYESDGHTPAANVAMYFYHTNAQGRYAKLGTEPRTSHAYWHGYNRGWLRTDARGHYEIQTIRPAPYPDRTIPAHIHFYVKAPSQRQCYYLSDFVFADDPFLTESYWAQLEQKEGFPRYGGVVLTLQHDTLVGRRNIRLLPQYDRRPTQSGLLVGQECPAFDPWHVWGPDQGKRTCPMCAYGSGAGMMIWTRSVASDTLARMARFWETQLRIPVPHPLKVFIIYTNPARKPAAEVRQLLERFAIQNQLRQVAVLYVPAPDAKSSAQLYSINPAVTTTVLGFRQRRVVSKFIDPAATDPSLTAQLQSLR